MSDVTATAELDDIQEVDEEEEEEEERKTNWTEGNNEKKIPKEKKQVFAVDICC